MSDARPRRAKSAEDFSHRIRTARRSAGLSQQALADRLGVRRAAVTQWESVTGTRPTVANLAQAAVAMEVTFEWLATGRGSARTSEEAVPAFSAACIAQDCDEEALLAAYRALSKRQQQGLLSLLRDGRKK